MSSVDELKEANERSSLFIKRLESDWWRVKLLNFLRALGVKGQDV